MKLLMGLDIGTTALKAALFDTKGTLLAVTTQEYQLLTPQVNYVEEDGQVYWSAFRDAVAALKAKRPLSQEDEIALAISAQGETLFFLDEQGELLRRAIVWMDNRAMDEAQALKERFGDETCYAVTGQVSFEPCWPASKILWVRNHEPENYARCRHILLPKDYVRLILTGEYATEVSDASGMQLLDVPHRCWSDEVLEKLEIDKSMLAKVYESPEVTGTILPEIAAVTGLSEKTVVVGGAGDNAAAAVGTGVVADGKAFTTIGTSGVVFAHSKNVTIDPKGRVHTFCCAVPGCWHVMGVTQGAGLSLQWFRNNLCRDYMERAEKEGRDAYDYINEDVESVPLGSNRLIYLPYLMGERTPHLDPDCRGVFFGLSAIHTRKDMLRAVMEGVSYSMKDCNDILKEMGVEVDDMMACGGGGRSAVWRQMLADMYGCTVKTVAAKEGPALGVAILAGVGAGIYESVEAACEKMIHTDKSCDPIPEHTEKYAQYHKIYQNLYGCLKEQFKELAKL